MKELSGVKIHVNGIVQGVGFRPFVYGLAKELQLTGWVRNTSSGVDIELDGSRDDLEVFIHSLNTKAPPLAHIDDIQLDWNSPAGFSQFEIEHSEAVDNAFQPISPDICICPDCLQEMSDPSDRRYRYPFINCTNCGPRFTIIKDIPYDRPKTTMASFEMCNECAQEYTDPTDRRFHAQPVACPECGPNVWVETDVISDSIIKEENAISETRILLSKGKILAIKGLGGFHLACDATNVFAVRELRRRKLRVDKPFALMMPDIDAVKKYCEINKEEMKLLVSSSRPIVLLKQKKISGIAMETAPGQSYLGVMLPYTPLHYLLFDTKDYDALVMTSGNLSEEPIVTSNKDSRTHLENLADAFLMHDRDINIRCDDSVVRIFEKEILPIRRSRGYAPFPVYLKSSPPQVLACGAELKNTFCITRENYAILSQHVGDMQNIETFESYKSSILHYEKLFRLNIDAIAYDLHPDYLTTRYALNRIDLEGLPGFGIQHHHAHIASCMVENDLPGDKPVIGVAFDGTGYGEDGKIWGGEFMVADMTGYQRENHLKYVALPGGDLAVNEPWRIALSWLFSADLPWDEDLIPVKRNLTQLGLLKNIQLQLTKKINSPKTSSMGRLFDAVSALSGVRQKVNYEGQAAIELEALADPEEMTAYEFSFKEDGIDPSPMFRNMIKDLRKGLSIPRISARFHNGIALMTENVCRMIRKERDINDIVLSGGVWQNVTLLAATIRRLRYSGFQVFIHKLVPPNDGGLSLGQAMIAANRMMKNSTNNIKK